MKISSKNVKIVVFAFLAVLLVSGFALGVSTVKAQGSVSVTVLQSIGGSTDPAAGTNTYTAGQSQTFAATPDDTYYFSYWILASDASVSTLTDNPVSIPLTAGVTYVLQPYFQQLNLSFPNALNIPTPSNTNDAIVIVLNAVGGTTSPGPGTYSLTNAASLTLKATPLSGWVFDHWVIGGYPLSHGAYSFTDTPTNNPYNVNHGYGYTYSYQPVFSLVSGSATPTPKVPEFSTAAILGVAIVLVAVIVGSGVYVHGKRK